jgi:dephospho-CoA kinase
VIDASGQVRISVIGLSGCGKSTFASLVAEVAAERRLTHARLKLAKPLYDLQARVYETARVSLPAGAQDQVLLEALADALRRIRPQALAEDFADRLAEIHTDVVVNDDLRDPHVDAVALRHYGFRIVRVTADPRVRAERLAERRDLTRADRSTAELDLIVPDVVIDNSGELDAYRAAVRALLKEWL